MPDSMPDGKEITVVLTPGLEELIRALGVEMFGESSLRDPIEHVVALLLPDLVKNAMAGDLLLTQDDPDPPDETGSERLDGIAELIAEAEKQAGTPEVVETLIQQAPSPEAANEEVKVPSFDELCRMAEIHPDAVAWAKGNPSKEAALIETCIGMPTDMWSWSKMLGLAERTYNMRMGGKKDIDT